jgi:hypothetical protein
MGVSAVSLIGGVIILIATFAITYVVLGNFFKRTRELGDNHREELTRRRSLDSSKLRSAEEHVASPPAPPPAAGPSVRPPNPGLSPAGRQMVAELEEQARRSDQERRAKMRAHVERPVPPITPEEREAIKVGRNARLAIKHVFPPRLPQRSMSYFGGLPIIPDDFDWPTVHGSKGVLERLNFMAQIDCSDLPPGPGRHLLPDKGYLYFFAPMSETFGPDALHFVARYLPGPVKKSWEPVDMLATATIDSADPVDLALRGKRTHFDRFEIEFAWIEEPSDEEVAARSDEGHAFEVAQKMRGERLNAFYGPAAAHDPLLSAYDAPKDALWTPYEGFPANWATARTLRKFVEGYQLEEALDVSARIKALGEVPADDPEAERLSAVQRELSAVGSRIRNAFAPSIDTRLNPFDAPPDEVKQQIMAVIDELRVNCMPSSIDRADHRLALPQVLNKWLEFAAVHGAEAGLTDPEGAALIAPDVLAALAQRHASREHQMLGEGLVVQVAADEMKDRYLLLLQLGRDPALNWTIGEMGPLQYWITPEDLAADRFENTVLTIEAY